MHNSSWHQAWKPFARRPLEYQDHRFWLQYVHPEREENQNLLWHSVLHGTRNRKQNRILRPSSRYLGFGCPSVYNPVWMLPLQRCNWQGALLKDHSCWLQAALRGVQLVVRSCHRPDLFFVQHKCGCTPNCEANLESPLAPWSSSPLSHPLQRFDSTDCLAIAAIAKSAVLLAYKQTSLGNWASVCGKDRGSVSRPANSC